MQLISSLPHLEMVLAQLTGPLNLVITVVYFPPSSTDSCCAEIYGILVEHNGVIIIGDFNIPDASWQSMSANCWTSLSLCDFTYFMITTLYSSLITDPTHCKGNLLDLLITNSTQDLIMNASLNSLPFATDQYFVSWKNGIIII